MLISKNIQIEFADSTIKAIDAIYDIREGVRSASLNLYSRYGATYLLKQCNGRYDDYLVGKRLLSYTEIAAPDASENKFRMEDRLEAVSNFAKLLERSDEEAMDAISKILIIIKEVNQNDITSI